MWINRKKYEAMQAELKERKAQYLEIFEDYKRVVKERDEAQRVKNDLARSFMKEREQHKLTSRLLEKINHESNSILEDMAELAFNYEEAKRNDYRTLQPWERELIASLLPNNPSLFPNDHQEL